MRKKYMTPIIEKISFDYKIQLTTPSPTDCFGSVMNVKTEVLECGEGTPFYFGWNYKNPGDI